MARDYPDTFAVLPVDRVAARVVSKGIHHGFIRKNDQNRLWRDPPQTLSLRLTPEPVKRLLGERKGSLVVTGYLGRRDSSTGKKKGQRLLVRCDCGYYEVRMAHLWRKHEDHQGYCQMCNRKEGLKKRGVPIPERQRMESLHRPRQIDGSIPPCAGRGR
jgi:hypothetical protein